jgi:uncharacterized membrane protein
MVFLLIVLRLLHIVSGIFWVGAALILTFFVSPAARATQESGQKFMAHMMQNTPFSKSIIYAALISVLAGLALYWIDSDGLTSAWMTSGPGLGFGLGGLSALLGLHFGFQINRRSGRLMQVGGEISSQGTPPTEAQAAEIQTLQQQLKSGGYLNAFFLLLAAILMSTARFWIF